MPDRVRELLEAPPKQPDLARYYRWRSSVPFSNEEFADAFDQLSAEAPKSYWKRRFSERAQQLRSGRLLSGYDLRMCLSMLVKTCRVCSAPAEYVVGSEGVCLEHRDCLPDAVVARRRRFEELANSIAQRLDSEDVQARYKQHRPHDKTRQTWLGLKRGR